MNLAPEIVHHSASRLREPVIDAGKEGENSARRHDVVEMRDDVVSVVQIEIGGIKCQRDSGKSADAEHREKGGGEKHRHGKSNRAAPERDEKCAQNDDRRNGNDQGGGLEKCAHRRPHAGEPHVMGPDNEGKKTENASNNRKAVTNWAQTKKGRRIQVKPGARNWMMVVMKLIAPSSDDVIRKIKPRSQSVCPLKNGLKFGPLLAMTPSGV